MDLMLRRRAMMAAAVEPGPLYQLRQGTSSLGSGATGRNVVVTGAHIKHSNTGGGTSARNIYLNGTSSSGSAITSTWFSLHSGDVLVFKRKNGRGKTSYGTSDSCYISLQDTSGTSIVNAGSTIRLNKNNGEVSIADSQSTVTLEADVNVGSVYFYAQRQSWVELDLELWVNDVRYL